MDLFNDLLFVAAALCLALLGLALVLVGLWIVHRLRPAGKLRARVRKGLRRARRPLRRIEVERQKRERALDRAARAFLAAQELERQRAVPAEDLREHGAQRVRWTALKEAGYRTLADLAGVPAHRLARIKGVGDTTAERIAEAARDALAGLRVEPPRLPDPDLEEPRAPEVAAEALGLLFFADALGPEYPRLWKGVAELEARWEPLEPELGLRRWALGWFARRRLSEASTGAEELADDLEALTAGMAFGELEGRLRAARKERAPRGPAVLELAARRYPELCAVLEQSFARLGLGAPEAGLGIRGGLPTEVAERVEEFALDASGLALVLRGYQEFGAKYLLAQKRTILGDEMGLGKTIEALAAMAHLWSRADRPHFFVVAPAGLLWNWKREVERFAEFPARVLHGDDAPATLEAWRTDGGVAITSYATLRNLALPGDVLGDRRRIELLIADEAHYLKNPKALRTVAARRLIDRAARVSLLSGTPLENHPGEFVHLIRTVQADVVAELERSGISAESRAEARSFHRLVAGVYLRRNQRDVLAELPERIDVEEWVEPEDPRELEHYRSRVLDADFMGMRRATTLVGDALAPAKRERLEELFEDHRESGRKVIVFSFFLDVLRAVADAFGAIGTISGSVPPEERIALVDRFGAVEGHAVLAIQIDAGGTGLNLQAASAVVLVEPQLKPTTEAQAIARAHRMGQTERVIVHRLLARGTIDERLWRLVAEKRELFDAYARESATGAASDAARDAGSVVGAMIAEERAALEGRGAEPIES